MEMLRVISNGTSGKIFEEAYTSLSEEYMSAGQDREKRAARNEKSAMVSISLPEKEEKSAKVELSKEKSASERKELSKEESASKKRDLSKEESASASKKSNLSKEESASKQKELSEKFAMWHRRLGHAHLASLKSLIDGFDELDNKNRKR